MHPSRLLWSFALIALVTVANVPAADPSQQGGAISDRRGYVAGRFALEIDGQFAGWVSKALPFRLQGSCEWQESVSGYRTSYWRHFGCALVEVEKDR